ncbi:MAG: Na/Pi cotransporter family protein [Bdellovibrionales bacterium]|nr:Na/Pi cotransporter family protein [Bdellovibrionales bacterium]
MDWFKMFYTVLGGLGLFFYGMNHLSKSLETIGSDIIRRVIGSLTNNRFMAVIVGFLVTTFVQSSSITTVMIVGFVNAGLMNLTQAIGVIFGANIGTTITGWIISIKIGKYSLLLIGLGFIPFIFAKDTGRAARWGRVVFALGLVFLGLETMSASFKPLSSHPPFLELMTTFSADTYISLLATIAVGCLLTFVVQSSSAMLGITIALAVSGSITFQTALALVLGENIGTTITALLACVGANTNGKRAAIAHALFNVMGVIVISSFFWAYEGFIEHLISGVADFTNTDGEKPYVAAHIAAGHTIFNVANVIIFLPFLKQLTRLVSWIIPDKKMKEAPHLEFFGDVSTMSVVLGVTQSIQVMKKHCEIAKKSMQATIEYVKGTSDNKELFDRVKKYESISDNIQAETTVFLGKIMEAKLSEEESTKLKAIFRMTDELESITDYCERMVVHTKRAYKENVQFDDATKNEIYELLDLMMSFFNKVKERIDSDSKLDPVEFYQILEENSKTINKVRDLQIERMRKGMFPPLSTLTLGDILSTLKRVKNHTQNLAEAYQDLD